MKSGESYIVACGAKLRSSGDVVTDYKCNRSGKNRQENIAAKFISGVAPSRTSTPLSLTPVKARYHPSRPANLDKKWEPPTSGKSPICVSGIAKSVFSVAIRYCPCTDNPTPPPITIPSIIAM
ncbi:hypothetical protein HUJ04_008208 [Dendroctonus ponderosae]|nr:hypothetical protein HUJ04_008208 [Dendroctonus ponderosae]